MPKCSKCGRNFRNIQALSDHFRSVHPSERFVPPKSTLSRNLLVGMVLVIIVVGGLVGYLIYLQQQQQSQSTTTQTGLLGQAVSSATYQNLSQVSTATLSAIGVGQGVTNPNPITGSPLTANGKPEVLYIGAEYCPYCAAERWSLIVALSKFGTFSGLTYMLSSSTDVYANTPTFSFFFSSYSSQYISFVSVEEQDRSKNPLQTPTSEQNALMNQYDSYRNIPFVDLGNQYAVVSAQFSPGALSNMNWTQIASQLNNQNSPVAKAIDGAANALITAICKIDGGNPSSVCGESFAKLPIAILSQNALSMQPFVLINQETKESLSSRYAEHWF